MTQPAHQILPPSSTPLVLAGHVVDLDAGVLRDAHGASIALRPQAWAVLALLARQVGRVVTKTQLLDTVWPGRVVTDTSLARAVSDARPAFGSDGHRIIRTVGHHHRVPGHERVLRRSHWLPNSRHSQDWPLRTPVSGALRAGS